MKTSRMFGPALRIAGQVRHSGLPNWFGAVSCAVAPRPAWKTTLLAALLLSLMLLGCGPTPTSVGIPVTQTAQATAMQAAVAATLTALPTATATASGTPTPTSTSSPTASPPPTPTPMPTSVVSPAGEFPIVTDPFTQTQPAISGNIVVWTDERNGNKDIYGYNLSSGKEFQVTTDPADQESPAIFGGTVVWADKRNGNWDIYGAIAPTDFIVAETGRDFEVTFRFLRTPGCPQLSVADSRSAIN